MMCDSERPIPRNLEELVPGYMTQEERVRRWLAYEDARVEAVKRLEDAKDRARDNALKYLWDEVTYKNALAEAEMAFHEEADVEALNILKTPSNGQGGTMTEDESMLSSLVTERNLEQGAMDGVMYLRCPYCGCDTPAEPDAQTICCQECDKQFKVNNPYL